MSPYRLSSDDFELPPLPNSLDYDAFMAEWEAEERQYRRHRRKQAGKRTTKEACLYQEFDHWVVTDREWAESLISLHKLCQEFQIASPLDGKVCLQTETTARWVERDAYAQNPHQWDSDGQVWVAQP
jgi:DNA-binding SARP family transcriptional activator